MTEQSKQWTPEYVHDLLECSGRGGDDAYAYVADVHNAALAAMRDEYNTALTLTCVEHSVQVVRSMSQ
jgi:hypothetical protein